MKKKLAFTLFASAAIVAACGGGSDDGVAITSPAGTGSNNAMAPLDAPCLTAIPSGNQMTATVTVGPVTEVATLVGKAIGQTGFDGKNLDTIEVNLVGSLMNTRSKDFRFYLDPTTVLFPTGVTEYGHPGNYTKYRRFDYLNTSTGTAAMPSLLGMQANETRTFTMVEYQKQAPAANPQPAFTSEERRVKWTVQYLGREDVSAMGKQYTNACKLKLRYERENFPGYIFPTLEGTVWLAPGAGPVKLTGAPIAGIEMVSVETSGIVAVK